jgi:hypothetical protein
MPTLLIERATDTPIRPRDVDGSGSFKGGFGQDNAGRAAWWIVRFCQARGSWTPFNMSQLLQFCWEHAAGTETDCVADFTFDERWVYQREDARIVLTTAFVARCYQYAPVLGLPRKRKPRTPKSVKRMSRYERLLDPCI